MYKEKRTFVNYTKFDLHGSIVNMAVKQAIDVLKIIQLRYEDMKAAFDVIKRETKKEN